MQEDLEVPSERVDEQRQRYLLELQARCSPASFENVAEDPFQDIAKPKLSSDEIRWLLNHLGHPLVHWDDPSLRSLWGPQLYGSDLRQVDVSRLPLARAILTTCHLEGAKLDHTHLEGARLLRAHLENVDAPGVLLKGSDLKEACCNDANLYHAHLEGAVLVRTELQRANLEGAHITRVDLSDAYLEGANLSYAQFDSGAILTGVHLQGAILHQVNFENANLGGIPWHEVTILGDEVRAKAAPAADRAGAYRRAALTYRQLAVALRTQGIGGPAAQFHVRAERMNVCAGFYDLRSHSTYQRARVSIKPFLGWLSDTLLYPFVWLSAHLLAVALLYLLLVGGFTLGFWGAATAAHTGLGFGNALVLSITSFHGRGLQPSNNLTNGMRMLASIEAVVGLLLEALFIAVFIRRITAQ